MGAFDKIHAQDTKRNIAKGRYGVNQIDALFREYGTMIGNDTEYEVTKFLLNVFAVTLHDELDFGKARIQRVIEKLQNELQCYDRGLVTADDFIAILKDECKYEIEVKMIE
ncbi:MAG: hypothetical protein RSC99_06330 [Clostridiales bacterium]